jgi:hypothetical protein
MTDIFPLARLSEDIVRLLPQSLDDILRLCLVSRQFNNIYSRVVYAEVTLSRGSRPGWGSIASWLPLRKDLAWGCW